MKSKKAMIEYIGAGIVMSIVIIGGLFIMLGDGLKATGNVVNLDGVQYVGNTANDKFCSLNNYDFSRIPNENQVFFTNIQTALDNNFTYSENCD